MYVCVYVRVQAIGEVDSKFVSADTARSSWDCGPGQAVNSANDRVQGGHLAFDGEIGCGSRLETPYNVGKGH